MSYIGKEPQTGAYSMLDALTASATASYSLTLDSVAFVPESANHLLVSLNGSIQKAGSSYTVSGSTLTFSSTLASSDSIDFVLALGNVLDIGTPSDATVTNAKTNFVSTSSAAGLQIKGDGTTDGTLQLNCSQNSHGIKLKSPAHSTSSSYTLTFPGTDPAADKMLQTDGSGNLSFVDAPSGGLVPITTQAFGSGTDLVLNNVFSSTYVNYMMIITQLNGASDCSLNFRFNVGGTVDSSSNYRYTLAGTQNGGSGTSNYSNGTTDEGRLFYDMDADSEAGSNGVFYIHSPYASYQRKSIHGDTVMQKGTASNTVHYTVAADYHNSSVKNFTGINLFTSGATNFRAGSVSGGYSRVAIYGVVNS